MCINDKTGGNEREKTKKVKTKIMIMKEREKKKMRQISQVLRLKPLRSDKISGSSEGSKRGQGSPRSARGSDGWRCSPRTN